MGQQLLLLAAPTPTPVLLLPSGLHAGERCCPWCGDVFTPSKHNQVYCSYDHKLRTKLARRKARERENPPAPKLKRRRCAFVLCKRQFQPHTQTQVYCSEVHKMRASKARENERNKAARSHAKDERLKQIREERARLGLPVEGKAQGRSYPKLRCPYCGTMFTPRNALQRFCSTEHRKIVQRLDYAVPTGGVRI